MPKHTPLTYAQTGDNYDTKDPAKISAQQEAAKTSIQLEHNGFAEVGASRGESAFVWQQGKHFMASVIEGLGTKNLIADEMYIHTGKSYYDQIAYDTVATIINDLITVGAQPLVIHAYWALENNTWLADTKRFNDLVTGWRKACVNARVTWGGGETPTLKGIMKKDTIELGGSAVGIIRSKKRLLLDTHLAEGDRILLLKSRGINANGASLARAVAKRLPKGYMTPLPDKKSYGEHLLVPAHMYSTVIQELLDAHIALHYASNITGHGLRKVMRARGTFTYIVERLFESLPVFDFIQHHADLSDYEMYQTYNMGQDFALFIPAQDVPRAQNIIKACSFESLDAGYIEKGEKKVVVQPKKIEYCEDTLQLR